jgi:hypothetical protein
VGAKAYILMIAALAASGCSGGFKRFAPPGIVKYEDLAKGQPASQAITERIEVRKAEPGGGFPKLSEQPTKLPEGIAKPERDAMIKDLLLQRDALNAAMTQDRELANAERLEALEGDRDALSEAVERDDAAARRERGLPPREPVPVVD